VTVQFPQRAEVLLLVTPVRPAPKPLFVGVKWPKHEANCSPPCSAECVEHFEINGKILNINEIIQSEIICVAVLYTPS
jgi:hypothetical protein